MRRRLWLGSIAALGVVLLFWGLLSLAGSGGSGKPSIGPTVTTTQTAPPRPARTVTTNPHRTPGRPAPTNPVGPVTVPVIAPTVTRVEHPPTRSTTITRTRPAPTPSTRTVTRPARPPTSTSRPNPIRSVVCGLNLCTKENP